MKRKAAPGSRDLAWHYQASGLGAGQARTARSWGSPLHKNKEQQHQDHSLTTMVQGKNQDHSVIMSEHGQKS